MLHVTQCPLAQSVSFHLVLLSLSVCLSLSPFGVLSPSIRKLEFEVPGPRSLVVPPRWVRPATLGARGIHPLRHLSTMARVVRRAKVQEPVPVPAPAPPPAATTSSDTVLAQTSAGGGRLAAEVSPCVSVTLAAAVMALEVASGSHTIHFEAEWMDETEMGTLEPEVARYWSQEGRECVLSHIIGESGRDIDPDDVGWDEDAYGPFPQPDAAVLDFSMDADDTLSVRTNVYMVVPRAFFVDGYEAGRLLEPFSSGENEVSIPLAFAALTCCKNDFTWKDASDFDPPTKPCGWYLCSGWKGSTSENRDFSVAKSATLDEVLRKRLGGNVRVTEHALLAEALEVDDECVFWEEGNCKGQELSVYGPED